MNTPDQNEPQKYKVFHNNRVLEISLFVDGEKTPKSTPSISEMVSFLKEPKGNEKMQVTANNPEIIFNNFKAKFDLVEAAGGIVISSTKKLLVIKRNGIWDLPKGKVESGEKIEQAAIREVEEECGISSLKLHSRSMITYHIYFRKKWVLKPTYWFLMSTTEKKPLPQEEEGISDVKWFSKNDVEKIIKQSYPSLHPVFNRFLNT